MDFDKVRAGVEEISVSDSFVVDIERLSHVAERESSANSRISVSFFSHFYILCWQFWTSLWLILQFVALIFIMKRKLVYHFSLSQNEYLILLCIKQRNHSRKGSIRGGGEKKINSTAANGTAAAVEASNTGNHSEKRKLYSFLFY